MDTQTQPTQPTLRRNTRQRQLVLDAVRVRLGEQILANRILVMRRTRHAGYLVKLLPHPAGRKLLQILFHNRCLRWALPYSLCHSGPHLPGPPGQAARPLRQDFRRPAQESRRVETAQKA